MKTLVCLIVLPVLMLVGCKDETRWISLEFAGPVRHEGQILPAASPRSNESLLANQLEKMGIPAGRIRVVRDKEAEKRVHLHIAEGALDAVQKAAVKSYFIGLIQARQRANFRMSLTTAKADTDELTRQFALVGVTRSVKFETLDYFSTKLLDPQSLNPYVPMYAGERVVCAVTVRLSSSATVSYSRIERIEGKSLSAARNVHGEVRSVKPSGAETLMKIPASLTVDDADLRHLLNEGRLQVHFHLQPARHFVPLEGLAVPLQKTDRISFALSSIDVPDAANPLQRDAAMHQQCAREVAALGRPFSFHTGLELDGLRYATFWDEP